MRALLVAIAALLLTTINFNLQANDSAPYLRIIEIGDYYTSYEVIITKTDKPIGNISFTIDKKYLEGDDNFITNYNGFLTYGYSLNQTTGKETQHNISNTYPTIKSDGKVLFIAKLQQSVPAGEYAAFSGGLSIGKAKFPKNFNIEKYLATKCLLEAK
ncbi:MAG: hypothetical protein WCR55_13660 [Lentisphaerota bacterium]